MLIYIICASVLLHIQIVSEKRQLSPSNFVFGILLFLAKWNTFLSRDKHSSLDHLYFTLDFTTGMTDYLFHLGDRLLQG